MLLGHFGSIYEWLILATVFVSLRVKSFVQLSDKDRSRRGRKKIKETLVGRVN